MAKIEESKPGRKDGNYTRIFGDARLGALISRIHATSIRNGNELEKLIIAGTNHISDLDSYLKNFKHKGVFLAPKKAVKASKKIGSKQAEPDFMIFAERGGKPHCYIVELKDGDAFDTKKSAGELESMENFLKASAPNLPCTASIHFCGFNCTDKSEIVAGFKRKITEDQAMTGREFCQILNLDYDKIVQAREADQKINLDHFLRTVVELYTTRIKKLIGK